MLYDALHELLVLPSGPLDNLYFFRLPDEATAEVDVAYIPISGVGATRAFGSQPVQGGPVGVTHDGGVQYYHTGVQFQIRARDPANPRPAMQAGNDIRDVLVQYAGTEVVVAGELIVRCDVTTAPSFYEQDNLERAIAALTVEVWHRTALVDPTIREVLEIDGMVVLIDGNTVEL